MTEESEGVAAQFSLALETLKRDYPMIAGGLLDAANVEEGLGEYAYKVLGHYLKGKSPTDLTVGLDAFAQMSFEFIRLQGKFMKTGRYRSSSGAKLLGDLYTNQEKMEGYYLDGLFLTYAFWPNHTRILRYYVERFINKLPDGADLLEVGTGHGLMSLIALDRIEFSNVTGFDISPYSVRYAEALFARHQIDPGRTAIFTADVTDPECLAAAPMPENGWVGATCCEVLEHVEDPKKILNSIRHALQPGGRLFVTTVANIEADDHIFLFRNANEIRKLLLDSGFEIEDDIELTLSGLEDQTPLPLNYAGVAVSKG